MERGGENKERAEKVTRGNRGKEEKYDRETKKYVRDKDNMRGRQRKYERKTDKIREGDR